MEDSGLLLEVERRMRARSQRETSEKVSPKKVENDLAKLLKAPVLLKADHLFRLPKAKHKSVRIQVIECEAFLIRAQAILKDLRDVRNPVKLEPEFFLPFLISSDFEEVVSTIRKASGLRRRQLSNRLKRDLTAGVKTVFIKIQSRRSSLINRGRNLPELFTHPKRNIERAALAALLMQADEDRRKNAIISRYRESESFRIGRVVRQLSGAYPEAKIKRVFNPDEYLFQNSYLVVDYSELAKRVWTDVEVSANLRLFDDDQTAFDSHHLHQTEKLEKPKYKFSEIFLPENQSERVSGLIGLYKQGLLKSLSILLYGESGTGKTSLAHAIAESMGMPIVTVSADGLDEDELPYVVSFLMKKYNNGAVLLFDECESIWYGNFSWFLSGGQKNSEKGRLKQILEETKGVIVYTSNVEPPEAFRRRASYVMEMRPPNHLVRANTLKKEVETFSREAGVRTDVSESDIKFLAEKYTLSGGFYKQALVMGLANSGKSLSFDHLDGALREVSEAVEKSDQVKSPLIRLSDLILTGEQIEIVNKIADYSHIHLNSIARSPLLPRGVTILFEGPSGTGKTALAEALAHRLELRFRRVTPSTFLSKYVGETERMIKAVLKDAETEKYLLFLDEAEGMLSNRESAHVNWERTQIDEWLNGIEQFKGVFVAATNHKEFMDAAFSRRFLFKVPFNYPAAQERQKFLHQHLGTMFCVSALEQLARDYELSFGELRSVVIRAQLDGTYSASHLEKIAIEQLSGRAGPPSRRLGI